MSEVTVLSAARQRGAMPLRGRSYMAFALTPEPPIAEWLEELDGWLRGSSGFFAGRPVVLDLSAVTLTSAAISHLISELGTRGVRIMGLEGVAAEKLGPNRARRSDQRPNPAARPASGPGSSARIAPGRQLDPVRPGDFPSGRRRDGAGISRFGR